MTDDVGAADPGATTRRTLLLGAGAVGATAVLTACGTDDGDGDATGAGDSDATAPPAPNDTGDTGGSGGTKLAAASAIPVGGGAIFASQGVVVTQPSEGTFKGFSATCTHQGCPLADVTGGTINCSCHNSKFSIEDGSVKQGPASKALAEKTVTKDGDDILLG
jgi:Rieske Fe-S protein